MHSIPIGQALAEVLAQSGLLTAGLAMGESFRWLVRIAGSVPCYQLEAGSNQAEVPALLAELLRPVAVT